MKKQIFKISLALLSFAFSACLNDDKNPLDPSGSNNVLEFMDIAVPSSNQTAVHPLYVVAFGVSPSAEFNAILSYSGPNENNKDIDVTLEVDPIALDEYNVQNGTHYELLDEALYSIASMNVTIPKGQTRLNVPITVFPELYDLSINYALPLRIVGSSSGIISKTFGAVIFGTVVKNKFDGEYTVEGSMLETTNPAFVGLYPKNSVYLSTIDGVTVDYYDNEYKADHIFDTGAGASQWGGFGARIKFEDSTDDEVGVVSVVNKYGQGNNNRSAKLNTSVGAVNKMFFKADGTPDRLEIWYIMQQLNGCGCDRALWKEVFTYVGPRP